MIMSDSDMTFFSFFLRDVLEVLVQVCEELGELRTWRVECYAVLDETSDFVWVGRVCRDEV